MRRVRNASTPADHQSRRVPREFPSLRDGVANLVPPGSFPVRLLQIFLVVKIQLHETRNRTQGGMAKDKLGHAETATKRSTQVCSLVRGAFCRAISRAWETTASPNRRWISCSR